MRALIVHALLIYIYNIYMYIYINMCLCVCLYMIPLKHANISGNLKFILSECFI